MLKREPWRFPTFRAIVKPLYLPFAILSCVSFPLSGKIKQKPATFLFASVSSKFINDKLQFFISMDYIFLFFGAVMIPWEKWFIRKVNDQEVGRHLSQHPWLDLPLGLQLFPTMCKVIISSTPIFFPSSWEVCTIISFHIVICYKGIHDKIDIDVKKEMISFLQSCYGFLYGWLILQCIIDHIMEKPHSTKLCILFCQLVSPP